MWLERGTRTGTPCRAIPGFDLGAPVGHDEPVTRLEAEILEQLILLESTATSKVGDGPRPGVLPIVQRLTELTRQLTVGTDPSLLHYLHKRSYEKARFFLQGRDAENAAGNCGHI